MSYMDHLQACNIFDLSKFVPFRMPDNVKIGHIRCDKLVHLAAYPDVLELTAQSVRIKVQHNISEAMGRVTQGLRDAGFLEHWRDELYAVKESFAQEPVFLIERAATPFFGIRAYGVHINGFVRTKEGLKMWVAKRAEDRAICPGMLDNMVAGGQPAGLTLAENIIKECAEEANIGPELARTARPVGMISYRMETDGGVKPDVMFCYDLELPKEFVPQNTDGEVESFTLMPVEEVAEIVRMSFDFKFNCNLVIIDFLIRHGVIDPDDTADYEELVQGLRA